MSILRCLMVFAVVSASIPCARATAAAPTLEPAPCAFDGVPADWAEQHRIDCGWLRVPESRESEGGRTLRLFVAIARARPGVAPAAPMLYIHGGPGIATVDYFFPAFPTSKNWPPFLASRDIVYFDQRGTGRSGPPLCPPLGKSLESADKLTLSPRAALERKRSLYAACRATLQADSFDGRAYNSTATVEDAEDLRRALGVEQWNVYGVSYGTLVGLEYVRRHPDRLRSVILDSVFPPNSPNGAEQISSTAKAYEALQRACDRDVDCARRHPSILTTLATVTRRLDAHPQAADRAPIDGSVFASALWTMLVGTKTARWVPLAIERAAAGDEAAIRRIVETFGGDGTFGDYSPAQAMTVNCFEVTTGNTASAHAEMLRRYPQLANAADLPEETDALCAAWQAQRAPLAFFAPVESTVPVLLFGGEFDPATPYDDAVLASRYLPNSTLVFVPGASHAAFTADDCTRAIAYAFVANPARQPALDCLANRPPTEFPVDGLETVLD